MQKIAFEEPPVRFFEEFVAGQDLPTISRGPMMVGHQVRWAGACDNYDAEFHHDEYVAKAQGLPGIILSGPLMAAYLFVGISSWFGRDAKIVSFTDRNKASTMPRDMAYLHGRVTRKNEDEGRATVTIECWIQNQQEEVTTPAGAVIALPRRS